MSAELLRLAASTAIALYGGVHDTPKYQVTPPPPIKWAADICEPNNVSVELKKEWSFWGYGQYTGIISAIDDTREIPNLDTLADRLGVTVSNQFAVEQYVDDLKKYGEARIGFSIPEDPSAEVGKTVNSLGVTIDKTLWATCTDGSVPFDDSAAAGEPAPATNAEAPTTIAAPTTPAEQPAASPQDQGQGGSGPEPEESTIPEPKSIKIDELKKFSDWIDGFVPEQIIWALGIATAALATGAFAFFRTQIKQMAPVNFGKKIDFEGDEKKPLTPPANPTANTNISSVNQTENTNAPTPGSWQDIAAKNEATQKAYAAAQIAAALNEGTASSLEAVRARLAEQRDAELLAQEKIVSKIMGVDPKSLDELR